RTPRTLRGHSCPYTRSSGSSATPGESDAAAVQELEPVTVPPHGPMDRVPLRAELLGEHVHSEGASGLPQSDLVPVPQRESLGKRRLVLERGEADPRSIAAEPDLVGHALLDRTHVGLTVVQCYLESGATAVPLVRLDVPRGSRQVVPEGRAERPQLRSVLAL